MGPNGLRAGWRFLMFLALNAVFVYVVRILRYGAHPPSLRPVGAISPGRIMVGKALAFLVMSAAALVMTRVDKAHWSDYGLALRRAFRREFWFGVLWGIAGLSGVMACLRLGRFYAIDGLAIHGSDILRDAALWAAAMLLVGLGEEFLFRGYALYTLASGMGFWPAALFTSSLFTLVHMGNGGENWLGLTDVFLFALFSCATLWRTGNLWFAVGMHAAWDWGLTFIYSSPNSGMTALGQLFNVRFSGPAWLTGGSAGPEGSAINLVFDLIYFAVFLAIFRNRKFVGLNERRSATANRMSPSPVVDSSALRG